MNKHFLFIAVIVMAMTVPFASAKQIGPQQALEIARQFSTTDTKLKSMSASPAQMKVVYTAKPEGSPADSDDNGLLYVVSSGDNAGYVMVAGDDVVSNPVLGYSTGGEFDYGTAPDNLKWWIGEYARMIEYAAEHGMAVAETPKFDTSLDPMIKTHWNQDYPYNNLCPWLSEDMQGYTGCVATAMAQVMKYHRWPERGTGSHTYTDPYCGQTLSANFGETTYRWDLMPNDYDGSWTDEQIEAVATLMAHCGVAVEMMYQPDGSGAYSQDLPAALVNYFGYAKDVIYLERDYYTQNEWIGMVKDELDAGRPLYYSGASSSSGHAFVLDGYNTEGYFHVNWGWGAYLDGYFLIATLDPGDSQGIGGSVDGYASDQGAIFNLHRPAGNETPAPNFKMDSFTLGGGVTSAETVKDGQVTFQINNVLNSQPLASFGGYFGVNIEDDNGKVVETAYSEIMDNSVPIELEPNYGIEAFTIPTTIPGDIADGHYRAYPFYAADKGSEQFPIKARTILSGYADVVVAGDNVTISTQETAADYVICNGAAVVVNDSFTNGEDVRVYTQITNNGSEYYNSYIYFSMCKHGTNEYVYPTNGDFAATSVSIAPGETQTVKITQPVVDFYPGQDLYDIIVSDYFFGNFTNGRIPININNPDLEIANSPKITDPNPANLTLTATVKNPSPTTTYTGNICALIWKPYPEQGLMVMQKALDIMNVEIPAGQSVDLTLNGTFTECIMGDTYNISLLADSQALTSYMDLEYVPKEPQEIAQIKVTGDPQITNEDPENLTIAAQFENTDTDAEYDGSVSVKVYDNNDNICGDLGTRQLKLQAGATSETITFSGTMTEITPDETYIIRIFDEKEQKRLYTIYFSLEAASVEITDGPTVIDANPENLTVSATMRNKSPWFDFSGYGIIAIADNEGYIIRYLGGQTVEIPAGGSKEIRLSAVFDGCEPDYTYILGIGIDDIILTPTIWYTPDLSGITENLADGGTRLYPNPVGNVLNVVDGRGIDRVQVLGLTGSQVLDANVGGDTAVTIDMSALPAGTYIVRIVTIDGSATMQKIIKK